jgi:hypothetical protein
MKRGEIEGREIEIELYENYIYFGTNFELSNYTNFETEGVHIRKWFHSPFICPPSVPPHHVLTKAKK